MIELIGEIKIRSIINRVVDWLTTWYEKCYETQNRWATRFNMLMLRNF